MQQEPVVDRSIEQVDHALPDVFHALERAAIVTSHKTGRIRTYQLAPGSLQLASAWLAEFRNHWERRLHQLDHLIITAKHAE